MYVKNIVMGYYSIVVWVQLLNSPKQKGPFFSKFKFPFNGGDLVFWFAFNRAVHFRT